jgi:D-alanyl-D-alanine carboxypeptidase
MNDQAQRLGLKNTHFENPHGLDSPEHYSTARDLAVLAAYAMEDPIFAKTVSTKTVRAGQRSLQNHNKLLWRLEGADGVKTGFTKAAGRILVSSAARNGRRVICVTINDGNDWVDHATLLENAFSRYTLRKIISEGDFIGTVEVAGGKAQMAQLLADSDFSYPLAEGEEPEIVLSGPGFAYAPVVQGKRAGTAYICIGDACIGKIDVIYGQTVEQEEEKQIPFWKRLLGVGL